VHYFRIAIAFCLIASSISRSFGATITSSLSKEGKVIIGLKGQIRPGDMNQFSSIVETAKASGKLLSEVHLNSQGGNVLEGAKLANAIRTAKLASVVPDGATCASACFFVFAAGTDKKAGYSSIIGVHGASDAYGGKDNAKSDAETVSIAKIVESLGVPRDIIGRMVATPPNQMVWLTADDLRAMGAILTGKPAQIQPGNTPPQPPAQTPSAAQSAPLKWENLLDEATNASSLQHDGKPKTDRTCQPESKTCVSAIFFTGKDGKESMMQTIEDTSGKVLAREICEFNHYDDVRLCFDFDKGTTHREMKDASGSWSKAADQ